MRMNLQLARDAIARVARTLGVSVEEAALSIVRMANENMANAIRLVTVDRGLDHRSFDLLAFGGAGPLHAGELAQSLGMPCILVPPHPGLTSAFGVMSASPRVDRRWTRALSSLTATGAELRDAFDRLVSDALGEIAAEGYGGPVEVYRSVRMRYMGQNYEQEIGVPEGDVDDTSIPLLVERFHAQHEAFYGYAMRDNACELAQLNVTVQGSHAIPPFALDQADAAARPASVRDVYFGSGGWTPTPIWRRGTLAVGTEVDGPCIIEEVDSTTVVLPGHQLVVHERGALELKIAVGQPQVDARPAGVTS
jgi:N-methylhydantoinase A